MKRKITSVPQLYRNVRRWTEIVSVMSKYGLADWMSRFHIDFLTDRLKTQDGAAQSQLTHNARIRMTLTELGPTFIKFGQLLSTRPDLIGLDLALELEKLQSNAPKDPFEITKRIIENEQGIPLEDIFIEFEEEPIASASIGQVHRAKLDPQRFAFASSEQEQGASSQEPLDVVVKVRHDGIDRVVETDLDILSGLAQLADKLDDFKNYQPIAVVEEMSRTMKRELDFGREERNLIQFRSLFEKEKTVVIPEPISALCSARMITMQHISGTSIRKINDNCPAGVDPSAVAQTGANLYLKMIFHHGFFHADPHPGNIIIQDDGTIGLLDFGMVGRISEQLREDIEAMLVAIVNQDVSMLSTLIKRIGRCPSNLNESAFSNEVADFVGQYSTQILAQFDMSGALNDFMSLVRRFEITLPGEVSLLIKVLVSLEGTGRQLNPDFSLMEIMKPFQRLLLLKRLSPTRQAKKMRRFYMEMEQLVDQLPKRISNILEQVQSGQFDVKLDHRRLGPTANRLVMGLMTSALFLGSSLMLSYKVPPLLFPEVGPMGSHDLSILGLAGCLASIMMGFRLTWAIRKSGNLDQTE
ncbi:MAG: AarF/UbiB family protein [Mariniblastus sp.]|nr:AarF/UbiB family protein [Mariniblastus sp.]